MRTPVAKAVSIGTFIATLLGGLFGLYQQDRLRLILGFSAGALIGAAFFDLIPKAFELGVRYWARNSSPPRSRSVLSPTCSWTGPSRHMATKVHGPKYRFILLWPQSKGTADVLRTSIRYLIDPKRPVGR
jgi:hypothetical protein